MQVPVDFIKDAANESSGQNLCRYPGLNMGKEFFFVTVKVKLLSCILEI